MKSYNYGVPTQRRARSTFYRPNHHHGSIFGSSSHPTNDTTSYAKPAEIYVYARKRPLLSTETKFQDVITVPDQKRIIVAESKTNLDCSPLLKRVLFAFSCVILLN